MSVLRKLDDLAQEFRMQDAVQTPTGKVKFAPILIQSHINKRKRFIGL